MVIAKGYALTAVAIFQTAHEGRLDLIQEVALKAIAGEQIRRDFEPEGTALATCYLDLTISLEVGKPTFFLPPDQ